MLSLQNNPANQAHSGVPECDGQLTAQVKSDRINKMVTPYAGVQTDPTSTTSVNNTCQTV